VLSKYYNRTYTKWKNWSDHKFGYLSNLQEIYFKKEFRKTNLQFSQKLSVLEVGFGNGAFLTFCKKNKWEVYGIEAQEELVKLALNKGINAKKGPISQQYKNNSFDLIVAIDVLEHLTNNEISSTLKIMKKKLKPNGIILARFPNGDSPLGLKLQNGDITHKTFIGSEKAKYFASLIDSEIVSLEGEVTAFDFNGSLNFIKSAVKYLMLSVRRIINIFLNLFFYDGTYKHYTSSNLVLILKI
jgi:2-polyprenyl-3-methyl-5-hydroxy-6-metoxy-1,4-benzoquinol methylase